MFLRIESSEYNGVITTFSELSASQRIERLTLMRQQIRQVESDGNWQVTVENAIRTSAFVVAASLWHNHLQKIKQPPMDEAVKQIKQEMSTIWPTEVISHAENVVYRLSSMYRFVMNNTPDQAEDPRPAGPISARKCSTVN